MKNRVKSFVLMLVVVTLAAIVLVGCDVPTQVVVSTYSDDSAFMQPQCSLTNPGYCLLDNDKGGPFPAIAPGANACRAIYSSIDDQKTLCRVVHGFYNTFEADNGCGSACLDHTNYQIRSNKNLPMSKIVPDASPWGAHNYGWQLGTPDGHLYEGCEQLSQVLPGVSVNDSPFVAICDFSISKEKTSRTSSQTGAYYLNALWGTSKEVGSATLCVYGLVRSGPNNQWTGADAGLCAASLVLG
jgi:hypothetical protein